MDIQLIRDCMGRKGGIDEKTHGYYIYVLIMCNYTLCMYDTIICDVIIESLCICVTSNNILIIILLNILLL